ncbi:protein of unknown function [Streptantibioticus cattleyicolor NRRL 8057 = DSM 46488]|nr:protein of unknown function [Streptantibioticus cattleyicolor NRRL 8057 = DSM 46488]
MPGDAETSRPPDPSEIIYGTALRVGCPGCVLRGTGLRIAGYGAPARRGVVRAGGPPHRRVRPAPADSRPSPGPRGLADFRVEETGDRLDVAYASRDGGTHLGHRDRHRPAA